MTAGPITAALLNTKTVDTLFLLRGHEERLTGVTFDAASRRIFTVALDGDVRVYNCRFCGDLEGVKKVARRKLAAFTRS